VLTEFCEVDVESIEINVESELQAEIMDCKETIKLEIKQEIQDRDWRCDNVDLKFKVGKVIWA